MNRISIKTLLTSWAGWLLMIIALRVAIGFLTKEKPSSQDRVSDALVQMASSAEQQQQKLAFDSLYQIGTHSPEHRQKIYDLLKEKNTRHSSELERFLTRLDTSPEMILKRAIKERQMPLLQLIAVANVCINIVFAFLLLFCLPMLLTYVVNRKCLTKIFGRCGWQKIVLVNAILWGGLSLLWRFSPQNLIIIQAIPSVAILWFFNHLVKSHTLVLFLGINKAQEKKTLWAVVILLGLLLVPYLWANRNTHSPLATETIIQAIDEASEQEQKNVTPLLVNILNQSTRYAQPVIQHTIAALGALGREDMLPHLLPFLSSPNPEIQKATLKAVDNILQRARRSSSPH